MDLKGSLIDTNLRIYPTTNLIDYFKTLPINDNVPINIARLVKGKNYVNKQTLEKEGNTISVHLNSKDIENLNKIKAIIKVENDEVEEKEEVVNKISEDKNENEEVKGKDSENSDFKDKPKDETKLEEENNKKEEELYLTTSDIDWLYTYLQNQKYNGDKNVPYLHDLLQGVHIDTPDNLVLKRNPVLEARCVKLRAQQEAREYRKMTKSVDNVRLRFPEDSISYQLKQVNRQLIAIGQFIISIFAGFLFGFRGVEWMVGNLDFGFRLLLGVMCALVIALAEIYFLAKKLNEELNIPETVQLGGPPKFADQTKQYMDYIPKTDESESEAVNKEHQD